MKVSPELPPRLPPPLLDVILCGGFAGGIADTALHGMDTIKTRMQTSHRYSRSGLMATIRIIVAEEGPRALFGGLGPAMTGSLVSTMVYFASYESIKRRLSSSSSKEEVHPLACFVAAGVGDALASIFYVPSEVLKTRLQSSHFQYSGALQALDALRNRWGWSGLYKGWASTLLRDVPFSAIQFTLYELLQHHFHRRIHQQQHHSSIDLIDTTIHDMVAGGIAGALAGALTTPLDVVKTTLQTQRKPNVAGAVFLPSIASAAASASKSTSTFSSTIARRVSSSHKPLIMASPPPPSSSSSSSPPSKLLYSTSTPHTPYYGGIVSAFRGIHSQHGFTGLFSGLLPRTFWTGAQSMIMFLLFERFLDVAGVHRSEREVDEAPFYSF